MPIVPMDQSEEVVTLPRQRSVHFAEKVETQTLDEVDKSLEQAALAAAQMAQMAQMAQATVPVHVAVPSNVTKADGNLPTCYYLATSQKAGYEGDYQWIIELEKGWSTWLPGNEPFQGSTNDGPMRYTLGRYDFEVSFDSESQGVQRNLTTGKVRRLQRIAKGEALPAWEGTGLRRRPAAPHPAPAAHAAHAAHGAHGAPLRRGPTGGYAPHQSKPPSAAKPGGTETRPEVSHAAYTTTARAYPNTARQLPHYMKPLRSKA